MSLVVPTITAADTHQFRSQTELVASISDFAHLDLASSDFGSATDLLDFNKIYLDPTLTYSVHLMYGQPVGAVKYLLSLDYLPKIIILQAESHPKSLLESIKMIKDSPCLLGIALLQESSPDEYSHLISMADQVLIFSGNLGEHGGRANLELLSKVPEIKNIKDSIEIAWDGGINKENISDLAKGGIEVFYVGSKIHKSADPYQALHELRQITNSIN